jgi:predicted O-methyltransferase YrrM
MHWLFGKVASLIPVFRRMKEERDRLRDLLERVEAARWDAVRAREEAEVARWDAVRARERLAEEHQQALRSLEMMNSERQEVLRARETHVPTFEMLEGTPYSRYAIPLEYKPSRDFMPRWGYSRERIPDLDQWFHGYSNAYSQFLELMHTESRNLRDIPLEYREANLPQPAWVGAPYAPFDAVALYTIIKKCRPQRYIEIGSGISTCFAAKAILDGNLRTRITSIDPEPRAAIDKICDTTIRDGLEVCDVKIFDDLESGDVLFFDGSHRTFMNSDVTVFFIDVLPRIKPGVIVHVHDISLPWDYDHLFKNWYWNEAYMLAVYMMAQKHRIDPLLPTSFVCRDAFFDRYFEVPMVDLGEHNDGWRSGGAMWFTHTA